MCDYSLHNVASRPAKVGDRLTTRDFGTGTRGFAASEDARVAKEGQEAVVLQLPMPRQMNASDAETERRVAYVG
jgi:hypothetical protein